jgi:hypothetical protein
MRFHLCPSAMFAQRTTPKKMITNFLPNAVYFENKKRESNKY